MLEDVIFVETSQLKHHRPIFQVAFLARFQQNRIHEQLDDMVSPVILAGIRYSFQTCVYVMTMKHLILRAKRLQTVSVKLHLHDAIYRLQFHSNSLIDI